MKAPGLKIQAVYETWGILSRRQRIFYLMLLMWSISARSSLSHDSLRDVSIAQGRCDVNPGYASPVSQGSGQPSVRMGTILPSLSNAKGNRQQEVGLNAHLCEPTALAATSSKQRLSSPTKTQRVLLKCFGGALPLNSCGIVAVLKPETMPSHSEWTM